MSYSFNEFKTHMQKVQSVLREEYAQLQTGRANPAILDGVKIVMYGTEMPINQVGSVTVEDAKTLLISPWDVSAVQEIEKALRDNDNGFSIAVNDAGVRVCMPDLTIERREQLQRVVREKLEQSRIVVRTSRDGIKKDIEKKEKDGELSEDEKFKALDDMQKIVDETNDALAKIADTKVEDLKK